MFTESLQNTVKDFIGKTFAAFRLHLLGPDKVSKKFIFTLKNFEPKHTLAAAYLHANSLNSVNYDSIDKAAIEKLRSIAEEYINSLEQKSTADLLQIIGAKADEMSLIAKREGRTVEEVLRSDDGKQILKDLKAALKDKIQKTNRAVELLTNHEVHNAQSMGALDGILSTSRSLGIEDPTIFKIGILDDKRCLVEGSQVATTKGFVKVEDLKVGDVLRSHKNLLGHQDRSFQLNSVVLSTEIQQKESIEVVFDSGHVLRCTKDHPILIYFNHIYLFWPIGELLERKDIDFDFIDIKALSLKERKKLTANLTPALAKQCQYGDFWEFIQNERENICNLYSKGTSIVKICHEYKVDMKNEKYISAILKLSKAFQVIEGLIKYSILQSKRMRGNSLNREYLQRTSLQKNKKLEEAKEEIFALYRGGESTAIIAKKIGVGQQFLMRFIKKYFSVKEIFDIKRKQKAKGGRAVWEKIKECPQLLNKVILRSRQVFMRTALCGSRPQKKVSDLLVSFGHKVEYNCSLFDSIRVDMVVDDRLVVEFDGSGHDMQVRMGKTTHSKLRKNDYARDSLCKKHGYSVLRIYSKKDKIPEYNKLEKAMEDAKRNGFAFINED